MGSCDKHIIGLNSDGSVKHRHWREQGCINWGGIGGGENIHELTL
jgi:hypothetical protein